jgi:hypothetical protein
MADILEFTPNTPQEPIVKPVNYFVDVELYPDDLHFTVRRVKTDKRSLLKIASELETIASIIRSDVICDPAPQGA